MILKNLLLNCWGLAILPKVLVPQTSQPYSSTGATTQSNNFKRTLTGVLPTLEKFLRRLWYALSALLYKVL